MNPIAFPIPNTLDNNDADDEDISPNLRGRNLADGGICTANDMRHAQCYKDSHKAEYEAGKAVWEIERKSGSACTGWMLCDHCVLVTNAHCFKDEKEVLSAKYFYMYEAEVTPKDCLKYKPIFFNKLFPPPHFEAEKLIHSSIEGDYALIKMKELNLKRKVECLKMDKRAAVKGEKIYIPQHPDGFDKAIAIYDSYLQPKEKGPKEKDAKLRCEVKTPAGAVCDHFKKLSGYKIKDVEYTCDASDGSSGSPVVSVKDNKVIAMHHCRPKKAKNPCMANLGVPIVTIYDEIMEKVKGYECDSTSGSTGGPTGGPTNPPSTVPTSAPSGSSIPTANPTGGPTANPTGGPTSSF